MADVRNCPSCSRPNGVNYARCMYCGTELPAPTTSEALPDAGGVDPLAEADKARELLDGLSPEARALMPDAVIRKLEAQVAVGDGYRKRHRGPITAEIAEPDDSQAPTQVNESAYDVPEPSPEGDPSIPDMDASGVESFDVAPVSGSELEPYQSLRLASQELLNEFEDTVDGPAPSDPEDAYYAALTAGPGPFGKRDAPVRIILLPDEGYRGKAHWLRHRLATALGVDLYSAGQSLQRDVPSFLGAEETFEVAEDKAERLRAGGMMVLTIDRVGWLEETEPEQVVSAEAEPDGDVVVFHRLDGTPLVVRREDFSWAAFGEIEPDSAEIPLLPERTRWRTAQRGPARAFDIEGGPYLLLDLLRRSSRRPIRVRSDRFDFSCLGGERALAAALNLRRLAGWVGQAGGAAIPVDERFKRVPHVPGLVGDDVGSAHGWPRREVEFTEYVLLTDAPNHV
jgi:hypothetical protein